MTRGTLGKRVATLVLVAGFVVGVAAAKGSDPWEFGTMRAGDDDDLTINTLSHGLVQDHDLDQAGGGNDQDWMVVPTIARHSYEARLSGTSVAFDLGSCPFCAQFERVDASGSVLTNDAPTTSLVSYDRTVRWIATSTTTAEYIRVTGDTGLVEGPGDVYTIRFWDTTYSVARWNNAGGQVTTFVISNLTDRTVTGRIDFRNVGGTLLFTRPMTIGPNQLHTFNTATEPSLAGLSGHAYVAHDAGYGGLAGKAVALEPSTGFSFDTLMVPFAN